MFRLQQRLAARPVATLALCGGIALMGAPAGSTALAATSSLPVPVPAVSDYQLLTSSTTPPTEADCFALGRRCFTAGRPRPGPAGPRPPGPWRPAWTSSGRTRSRRWRTSCSSPSTDGRDARRAGFPAHDERRAAQPGRPGGSRTSSARASPRPRTRSAARSRCSTCDTPTSPPRRTASRCSRARPVTTAPRTPRRCREEPIDLPFPAVNWPASDPLVTGVGGTYLCTDPVTVIGVNTPTRRPTARSTRPSGRSAGSPWRRIHHVFAPAYQDALPAGSTPIGSMRGVPDVAFEASATTGLPVSTPSQRRRLVHRRRDVRLVPRTARGWSRSPTRSPGMAWGSSTRRCTRWPTTSTTRPHFSTSPPGTTNPTPAFRDTRRRPAGIR